MNLSAPFVRRPVGTALLTSGLILAGIGAFFVLPVSPLPQVDFPTISVSASLPGASPETMASSVATPLERRLGVIADVNEMTSSSSRGRTQITLQFNLDRDIDGAARDVQAAINAARADLPATLRANPTYRKVNPSDAPIMILALTSRTRSPGQIYDSVSNILQQRLLQVSGVGDVELGGGSLPAVRVEIVPFALSHYGISLEDIRTALNSANPNRPKGTIENSTLRYQLYTNDNGRLAANYRNLVIAWRNGAAVRLSDVAEVDDSVEDIHTLGLFNGESAVVAIVTRQPAANIIATVDAVKAILPQLRADLPQDVNLEIASDRTTTIRASLHEVEVTLLIALLLVVLVVSLFLTSARATLVPAAAVIASLLGTLGVMYLAGYSLNNLSLMALTVATGFVVDDAIVVLENVARHLEAGMNRFEAALLGAREVGFTVLSISLSLVAVFIPLLFMGGIVGRLFREFAVTLSTAVLISLVISLTTTPMMCAFLLRPQQTERPPGRLARGAKRVFDRTLAGYGRMLDWSLAHAPVMILLLIGIVALNVYLFITVPKGFFPEQDTGQLNGGLRADASISFQAMQEKLKKLVAIIRRDPAVVTVVGFTGGSRPGGGFLFATLKPAAERKEDSATVIGRLRPQLARVTGVSLFLNPVQDVRAGGRQSNSTYQYTLQSDDLASLRQWAPRLADSMKQQPVLTDIDTDQEDHAVETYLDIDRASAARFGIAPRDIDNVLYDAFGQRQVSTLYTSLNQYHVIMEVAPRYAQSPESLNDVYVPAHGTNASAAATSTAASASLPLPSRDPTTGSAISAAAAPMVPLSAFAHFSDSAAPASLNHQNTSLATTISFNMAPGRSLSDAQKAIEQAIADTGMPTSVHGSFQGTAKTFQESVSDEPLLIAAALFAIYIVLGILYESYVHPLTVLSTLPSAGIGAVLALMLFNMEFSIIALIGVILLIGIVKKNAILIIDFALEAQRTRGLTPREAIREAALLRFRPILMTTLAAALGALPLAIGFGEGAELRRPLGVAIVGGLLVSQLLTLLTTPVVYLYLDRLSGRRMLRRAGPLAAATLAVSGCAIGPRYHRPEVATPAQYKEAVAQTTEATQPQEWWTLFGDDTLNDLERQVVVSNQNLAASEAAYRQALAVIREQRGALLPVVTLDGGVTRAGGANRSGNVITSGGGSGTVTTSSRSSQIYQASAGASWEIDLWGRLRRQLENAHALADASAADLAFARLSIRGQLATAYLQLREVGAEQRLVTQTVEAYGRSLQIVQNRYNAGAAAKTDLLQAQTQLANAQDQGVALALQRAQLEHAIAALIGKTAGDFTVAAVEDWHIPVPDIPAGVPSTLLQRRPDIAAAERRVAAANASIGVAEADYFPSLTLDGTYGFLSTSLGSLFKSSSESHSASASLAETLFNGGALRAQVAGARAAYDQTVAEYRQTVLTAFQNVEDQLAASNLLAKQYELRRQASGAADEAERLTQIQYKAGTISYTDVVVAQTAALTARRSLAELALSRQTTAVSLVTALGGGWER